MKKPHYLNKHNCSECLMCLSKALSCLLVSLLFSCFFLCRKNNEIESFFYEFVDIKKFVMTETKNK